MAHLVILFRTVDEIQDCTLFTRECGELVLDTRGQRTSYRFPLEENIPDFWHLECQESLPQRRTQHSCTESKIQHLRPHRKISHVVFHSNNSAITDGGESDFAPQTDYSTVDVDIEQHFNCKYVVSDIPQATHASQLSALPVPEWQLFIVPHFACTLLVNGHLASCLAKCIYKHRRFRLKFCKRLLRARAFMDCVPRLLSWGASQFEKLDLLAVPYMIDIVAVWPEQKLDYKWGWRMNHLLTKRMLLEDAMAWLSTLGGAHSSLGEYFRHHAEMAGQISIKQLQLAMEMGDPFTVARCYMFWAYSLIQRGITSKAKVIVSHVHSFAAHHAVKDTRLINMSLAAWKRLQHLHRLHRHARLAERNNNLPHGAPNQLPLQSMDHSTWQEPMPMPRKLNQCMCGTERESADFLLTEESSLTYVVFYILPPETAAAWCVFL
ncbi:hypothetical protein BaRGS_00025365 [Batillaria attramentaria]|uniref:Uncharacterized protein n=1 Tax=Batillaria attramentaria TaxID=370345 RepID=A0ABD0K8N8_9CAEN